MKMKTQHTKIRGINKSSAQKVIAENAYIKKKKKSQVNNLTLYLKDLEKDKQVKPKAHRWKEIIIIR